MYILHMYVCIYYNIARNNEDFIFNLFPEGKNLQQT